TFCGGAGMEAPSSLTRKPLVVIAGQHSWLVRSLESIFTTTGFTVVATGGEPLTLPDVHPDLLILEADPPDVLWGEVFAKIRSQPGITGSTPIIVTTAE